MKVLDGDGIVAPICPAALVKIVRRLDLLPI
jgi:hypothetical protein